MEATLDTASVADGHGAREIRTRIQKTKDMLPRVGKQTNTTWKNSMDCQFLDAFQQALEPNLHFVHWETLV